jgi:hypothetical protein
VVSGVEAGKPRFVQLRQEGSVFVVALLDAERRAVGHGYRGPTAKRAQADVKYWKQKGLEELPSSAGAGHGD